ncbi:LysE family transporter [Rubritalea tangerina]|uniref:LysE family transporter n=2 Tax=Rubritalea tangerina TaxID=430798 RepID=A0ABW4Z7D8_9BACT
MGLGQFSPGPDMVLLTRTALSEGKSAGLMTALGIACGLVVHGGIAVAGVATLMAESGVLSLVLGSLAAIYLSYLGVSLLRHSLVEKGLEWNAGSACGLGVWGHWRRGFLCNLLNPKVMVFLAGVVTPFLALNEGGWWPWVLWTSIWVEGLILWSFWVLLLQWDWVQSWYNKVAKWVDMMFGLALIAMAVVLLVHVM